jgi:hypothetical protein
MPFLFDTVRRDITEIFVAPEGRWTSIIFIPCQIPVHTLYNESSRLIITQTRDEAEMFERSSPLVEFYWGSPSPIVFPRLFRQNALSVNEWNTLI